MDTLKDLETQFNNNPVYNQSELIAKIKNQKAIINKLIETIHEASDLLLTAASSAEEPDKLLQAAKVLTQSLAEVAKA
ncbi:hypothetical protein [Nostoc punctiforme]|uniref:Histidine kinase n=1 Tax=Nostoc punctiforme NIES-2108 TaxID=1356359 RepID=A0A367RX56_NOSPU|nr:hypothetical protein [Nostoc punctiforme]RCJ41118.1 hypothetical protein A6769_38860 [Nostoc punctiforme NIES-2108]